jgi:hypothetical protein
MKKIFLLLLFIFPFIAQAQEKPDYARTHTNIWMQLNNKLIISPQWYFSNEIHLRRSDYIMEQQQFMVRPGLNYILNKNLEIGGGYTFAKNNPYGNNPLEIPTTEHNLYAQFVLKHSLGNLALAHRYRWEHRFQDNVVDVEDGLDYVDGLVTKQRFRYRIGATMPVMELKENRQLYLTVQDEIFINSTLGFGLSGFNQNRLFAGMGYQFLPQAKVELGYMRHTLTGSNNYKERNSTIFVNLFYDIDLSKKK